MNWYYVEAGQQMGPVDDAALAALAAGGTVTFSTLIWKEGMANWQPCGEANPSILRAAPAPAAVPVAAGPAPGAGEAVCAECGKIFPINETIGIGNARVCAQCKPVAVQKMREGLDVVPHGALKYAGFWIRFAAKFLDGIILFVPLFVVAFVIGASSGAASGAQRNPGFGIIFQLVLQLGSFVGTVLYAGFFLGKYGATPGKMVCKIKVVTPEGGKIGYGLAFGRSLAEILSRLICSIGYIMAAFDEEKRALHDRMCNTRVVFQ